MINSTIVKARNTRCELCFENLKEVYQKDRLTSLEVFHPIECEECPDSWCQDIERI
jgi:hypothetical protein